MLTLKYDSICARECAKQSSTLPTMDFIITLILQKMESEAQSIIYSEIMQLHSLLYTPNFYTTVSSIISAYFKKECTIVQYSHTYANDTHVYKYAMYMYTNAQTYNGIVLYIKTKF